MTIFQPAAYPNSVALTISLANLGSSTADPPAGRESAEINQSSLLADDVLFDVMVTTGASPTAGRRIVIMAWGGAFDGTNVRRPAGVTGSNAALTPAWNWRTAFGILGVIDTTATSNFTYRATNLSLRRAFGNQPYLPARAGIFITHNTGVALNADTGLHEVRYTGPLRQEGI